ncbi:MAG: hypothetical protein J2P17_00310 [Mycobacterium sp.]|nr:hypothetical protein [Mycobacterium sp.]
MTSSEQEQEQNAAIGTGPDIGFTLRRSDSTAAAQADTSAPVPEVDPEPETLPEESADPPQDPERRANELAHSIAQELADLAPDGWRYFEAVFVLTAVTGVSEVLYSDGEQELRVLQPPEHIHDMVDEHRELSAGFQDGPWWRLLMWAEKDGQLEVDYDYGEQPFPDNQMLPPAAYLADLQAFPRERIPVWLGAYIAHGDRQLRPPEIAGPQARADREASVRAQVSNTDFPALPTMWRRWAVMSAVFAAAGSPWGPRIVPALGTFEGARRSGSTLCLLPGGRAVLSGGVWDAPALDAAYNDGAALPDLYAGAPEWVAEPVLNARHSIGLLSFCYWWDGSQWYRADSPPAGELSAALPGIWTDETVTDVICQLVESEPDGEIHSAVAALVAATAVERVTRDRLVETFGEDGPIDIDVAFYQLTMAGLTPPGSVRVSAEEAIDRVRAYILEQGSDTTGYPLDKLRAERIPAGWMVYVPTEPEEIAVGRAIFYVAHDGVLEQSSSSAAPSQYVEGFEERYLARQSTGV